jgi:hypothetical protein
MHTHTPSLSLSLSLSHTHTFTLSLTLSVFLFPIPGTREPEAPDSYCFTSGETNWSNNPVLFSRKWFNERIREIAFRDYERNNMFEFNVMIDWLAWNPPAKVCVSMKGIFTHHEVDQ